jgi:thymidylate synthase (methanogen type)
MPTFIKAKTPEDGWIRVVRKIMDSGMIRVDERGSKTRWHDNVMIHIIDPYSERVSKKYPFSETVLREKYATQLLNPDRMDFVYTYGERLNAWGSEIINQVDYVISKLSESPHSRRAVMTTWDPRKDTQVDEVPCLNHFVFMASICIGRTTDLRFGEDTAQTRHCNIIIGQCSCLRERLEQGRACVSGIEKFIYSVNFELAYGFIT